MTGLTDVIKHSIHLVPGFKPKRLHAYRIPERLKSEVDQQIQEMLDNGIIRPCCSPMASPLVCVLKGKEGCDVVRLAVDYRYVNRFTRDVAYPLPDISSVFQRIGRCNFVTVTDIVFCVGYQRGIGSPKGVLNRRQWAREGPGAR